MQTRVGMKKENAEKRRWRILDRQDRLDFLIQTGEIVFRSAYNSRILTTEELIRAGLVVEKDLVIWEF